MPHKADYKRVNDEWIFHGSTRDQIFSEIVGSVGIGDPSEDGENALDAFVSIGRLHDNRIIVLSDCLGTFEEIRDEAINQKDLLSLKRIYYDDTDETLIYRLIEKDGLVEYAPKGVGKREQHLFKHPSSTWPHFRDRSCTAILVPVDEEILENFDSSSSRVSELARSGGFDFAEWCRKARVLHRRDYKEGSIHPLWKAIVNATVSLLNERRSSKYRTIKTDSWY